MKLLAATLVLALTGCASGCHTACMFGFFGPGNPAFDSVANHYDTQDPCQMKGKPEGHQRPYWCGAGQRRATILDRNGRTIGYVK